MKFELFYQFHYFIPDSPFSGSTAGKFIDQSTVFLC